MALVEVRRLFLVHIVEEEVGLARLLEETLTSAGFRTKSFLSGEAALEEMKANPPHIVVSASRLPSISGRELLERVKRLSNEIEVILIEDGRDPVITIHNLKAGAYAVIKKPLAQMAEVISAVDRAAEKLYLQFKVEKLNSEIARKNDVIESMDARIKERDQEPYFLAGLIDRLSSVRDTQLMTEVFCESLREMTGGSRVVFFRHAPAYQSIVFSASAGMNDAEFKNTGLDFRQVPTKDYPQNLLQPERIEGFRRMMESVFSADFFSCWPLEAAGEIAGFFVIFRDQFDSALRLRLEMALKVLAMQYESSLMKKRLHDTATKDVQTGLLNKRGFMERLEEEVSRSRRIERPVSLIRIDVDHFSFYRNANGAGAADALLRTIGAVLRKSVRRTDVAGYLGEDDFAILLPHTDKAGAAQAAEKIRRMVEQTQFPFRERQPLGSVTVSIGVSEYPSLAADGENLIQSAVVALDRMKKNGRNRVCAAQTLPDASVNLGLDII